MQLSPENETIQGAPGKGPPPFRTPLHIARKILEALATVLGFGELEALHHGSHGAVEDGGELLGARVGEGLHGGDCRKGPNPFPKSAFLWQRMERSARKGYVVRHASIHGR